jgi:uncharacterized BrkB/YihY/UPF0761 family membrane protein
MELLLCIGVILVLGIVLLLMFIGGIISLFAEKPVRIKKSGRKVEIATVNQFSNAVPVVKDVIQ